MSLARSSLLLAALLAGAGASSDADATAAALAVDSECSGTESGTCSLSALQKASYLSSKVQQDPAATRCPGSVNVRGYRGGKVELINAEWNLPDERAGPVNMVSGSVVPGMKGRTYFGDSCENGTYSPSRYASFHLLGKSLKWTTDVSGAGCGCNAALYLTSLRHSTKASKCNDYYCDAADVCGVRCTEIDLQEANMHAWHSTLHVLDDGSGIGAGYGGGMNWNGHRDFTAKDYGPNSLCINTLKPYQVEVGFPVNDRGQLRAMTTVISQGGCSLSISSSGYRYGGRDGMAEVSEALREGMTPIISYWSHAEMLWMDGQGADGLGPCQVDRPDLCAASVKFHSFELGSISAAALKASAVPGKRRL